MVGEVLSDFVLIFSLVTSTVACLMSLLLWEILRRSPFGRSVLVLAVVMALFSIYHGMLLMMPELDPLTRLIKSGTLTVAAGLIGYLIVLDRRVEREAHLEGD